LQCAPPRAYLKPDSDGTLMQHGPQNLDTRHAAHPWTEHLRTVVDVLREGFATGTSSGTMVENTTHPVCDRDMGPWSVQTV